jgi:hypothetical protein
MPEARCALGEVPTADGRGCDAVVSFPRRGEGPAVDLRRWMRAVVGTDGGPGAPPLCAALARAPAALAHAPGEAELELEVVVRVPGNDLSQLDLRGHVFGPKRLPGVGADEVAADVDRAVRPLAEALRALGGTSSLAAAVSRVRCRWGAALPVAKRVAANEERNAR